MSLLTGLKNLGPWQGSGAQLGFKHFKAQYRATKNSRVKADWEILLKNCAAYRNLSPSPQSWVISNAAICHLSISEMRESLIWYIEDGGSVEVAQDIAEILDTIAAKTEDKRRVELMGAKRKQHYVIDRALIPKEELKTKHRYLGGMNKSPMDLYTQISKEGSLDSIDQHDLFEAVMRDYQWFPSDNAILTISRLVVGEPGYTEDRGIQLIWLDTKEHRRLWKSFLKNETPESCPTVGMQILIDEAPPLTPAQKEERARKELLAIQREARAERDAELKRQAEARAQADRDLRELDQARMKILREQGYTPQQVAERSPPRAVTSAASTLLTGESIVQRQYDF